MSQQYLMYNGKYLQWNNQYVVANLFNNNYQAVYDAYDTKPDAADAIVDNTMVAGLVSDGVWAKLDGFWVFANHITGADSLRDWKTPANTATAYNSPAFGQWQGWTGNASNAYIDLNWIPSVNGVNYQPNSASFGFYSRADWNAGYYHGIISDTKQTYIIPRSSGNTSSKINGNSSKEGAVADSLGMYITTCVDATDLYLYKNKVVVGSGFRDAKGSPTDNIYLFAANVDGTPTYVGKNQLSVAFTGAGLTQTDVNNITDRFETRMDYHGTGVIT